VRTGNKTLSVLRGTWIATAGPKQVLRGSWSAQALLDTPNAARGCWAILNDANQIALEHVVRIEIGCEPARTWSARILAGPSSARRSSFAKPVSGTWQAENDSTVKTFADLPQRTLEKRMADSWSSGGLAGNWWLKGSPP